MKSDSTCNLLSVCGPDKAMVADLTVYCTVTTQSIYIVPLVTTKKAWVIPYLYNCELLYILFMVQLSQRASDPWGECTAIYIL